MLIYILIGIVVLVLAILGIYIIFFGGMFAVGIIAYVYMGLSVGMAPALWVFMIIGAIIGLICTIKSAYKAIKAIKIKE